ncbi:MAG: 2Fe-2S iron-sulfur cluster-binding protein, partial [Actinomycetota bacterium]
MPKVVFTPSGLGTEVAAGTTVLQAARDLGVDLDSVCGGRGICGRCQVTFNPGNHPKWAIESDESALSVWTDTETAYERRKGIKPDRRLGCCATVQDDVVLDVPPESQV